MGRLDLFQLDLDFGLVGNAILYFLGGGLQSSDGLREEGAPAIGATDGQVDVTRVELFVVHLANGASD